MRLLILVFLFLPSLLFGQTPAPSKLTWQDNSSGAGQETEFLIERNLNGGAFSQIGKVGVNVTTYSDSTVAASGSTDNNYCYKVYASNNAGKSAASNEACRLIAMTAPPVSAPAAASNLVAVPDTAARKAPAAKKK